MKIDYDKPVKGRLKAGWYWAMHSSGGEWESVSVKHDRPDFWIRSLTTNGCPERSAAWRSQGWQFYPARLPAPATAKARRSDGNK